MCVQIQCAQHWQPLVNCADKKVMNDADLCKAVHTALGGIWDKDGNSFLKYVGKLEYF